MGFPTETTPATQEDIRLLNNRIRQNETVIQEINKWRAAHAGIDATGAGLDYPHPNQRVSTLTFNNGKGRLDQFGMTLPLGSNGLTDASRVFWLSTDPGIPATVPYAYLYASRQGGGADAYMLAEVNSSSGTGAATFELGDDVSSSIGGYFSLVLTNPSSVVGLYDFYPTAATFGPPIRLTGVTTSDPAGGTATDGGIWHRSDLSAIRVRLNGITRNLSDDGDWSTKTLSSDAITITTSRHKVDTQSAAATDDLSTINGGNDGQFLILTGVSAARVVTVKDGVGNLKLSADCPLASPNDTLLLVKQGSNWLEVSRSVNS